MLKKTKGAPIHAVFGLAGNDTPEDEKQYTAIAKSVLSKNAHILVVNDAKIALEAKCQNAKNKIIVISGTGSSVYGESGVKSAKAINNGYIFGDEGSGFYAGLKALKAALQDFDGRGEKTILRRLITRKLGVSTMHKAIPVFYRELQKNSFPKYIASFAPLVDKALEQNDAVARSIRAKTARELEKGVSAVIKRLRMEQKEITIALVGSMWNMPGLINQFQNAVKKKYPKTVFSDSGESPVEGAILLAKQL